MLRMTVEDIEGTVTLSPDHQVKLVEMINAWYTSELESDLSRTIDEFVAGTIWESVWNQAVSTRESLEWAPYEIDLEEFPELDDYEPE